MIKAIFWLFIVNVVCVLGGVVMGFVKLFEIAPLWLSITSLSVFILLIVALVLLVLAFFDEVAKRIKAFIDGLPKWLKKLLGIK